MKRHIVILLVFIGPALADNVKYDYSTPENALKSLEMAYTKKDMKAAIRSKSFYYEAKEMLESRFGKDVATQDLINEFAEVLELGFRKEIKQDGFPDYSQVSCRAIHKRVGKIFAILTETCVQANKTTTVEKIKAVKVEDQWKIIGVVEQPSIGRP